MHGDKDIILSSLMSITKWGVMAYVLRTLLLILLGVTLGLAVTLFLPFDVVVRIAVPLMVLTGMGMNACNRREKEILRKKLLDK